MADVVKVYWSGGKDSTCSVLLHISQGHEVKIVYYVPMFTNDIPLIQKCHYEFILKTAKHFESLGAKVYRAYGITYYDYVTKRSSRGKFKGRMFGFPCFIRGQCGFKRDSKIKACQNIDVGYFDYEDIGIACDEVERKNQLNEHKKSILNEMNYTEDMAFKFCREKNLLSPHYSYAKRDGCVLCPNAKQKERDRWFKDYPEAVPIVIELQEIVKKERPNIFPLRNCEWFIDTDEVQMSVFDDEYIKEMEEAFKNG